MNSLRITTTNMTHFMISFMFFFKFVPFYKKIFKGVSALHFDLPIRELSSDFQKHFFSKRILAVLWTNLLDVLKHFFS